MAPNLAIWPNFLFKFVILESLPSPTFKIYMCAKIGIEGKAERPQASALEMLSHSPFFPHGAAIITDLHVLQRLFIFHKMKEKGYMKSKYCYPSYPNGRKWINMPLMHAPFWVFLILSDNLMFVNLSYFPSLNVIYYLISSDKLETNKP